MASAIPCGALSTKPITYWLAWGRATGTSTPPRSFRQLLKGQDVPRVIIPEKRKRYGAAKRARASPGANPARVALCTTAGSTPSGRRGNARVACRV